MDQNDRLLSPKQVAELTSLHRTTLWRMESRGEFVSALRLGGKRIAYVESEVLAWIADRPKNAAS